MNEMCLVPKDELRRYVREAGLYEYAVEYLSLEGVEEKYSQYLENLDLILDYDGDDILPAFVEAYLAQYEVPQTLEEMYEAYKC